MAASEYMLATADMLDKVCGVIDKAVSVGFYAVPDATRLRPRTSGEHQRQQEKRKECFFHCTFSFGAVSSNSYCKDRIGLVRMSSAATPHCIASASQQISCFPLLDE